MGLVSDIEAASAAAVRLTEATRQHVVSAENLEREVTGSQTQLLAGIQATEHNLTQLQTTLETMEAALAAGFQQLVSGTETLDSRVKSLREIVLTEFETNHEAISKLVPRVQDALQTVQKQVDAACKDLGALVQKDNQLLELSEKAAKESEARSKQVHELTQSQRQDLDRQAKALTLSWQALQAQLTTQLGTLEESFKQTNSTAREELSRLLEDVTTAASSTDQNARTALVDQTVDRLQELSDSLTQRLEELKSVGNRPRQMGEDELTDLAKKYSDTVKNQLFIIDQIWKEASKFHLFNY